MTEKQDAKASADLKNIGAKKFEAEAGEIADRRRWFALALICAVQFMIVLDAAIVNVALPSIQTELGLSPQNLQWVINAYILGFGGFLLLGGRAADLLGRRRVFVAGLALFSLGSLAGGFASSGEILIVARGVQGFGGALVSPAALSILTTMFAAGAERNRALGYFGATAASGAASGAILGGVLTNYLGWEWVLFVNVPIGAAALFLSFRLLDARDAKKTEQTGFDIAGAVSIAAGLVLLVYSLVSTETYGWTSARTIVSFIVAASLIACFVVIENRARAPLVRFGIFRLPNLTAANAVALVHGTGPTATLFFLSLYLQQIHEFSALQSGLALLPFALMAATASSFTAPLVKQFGFKPMIVAGLLLMAAGLGLFSLLAPGSDYLTGVLPGSLLVGIGVTLAGVPLTIAAMTGVPPEDSGLASGLLNTSQQIGAAICLALLVTIAASQTAGGHGATSLAGLKAAFLAGAALLATGALVAGLFVRAPAGETTVSSDEAVVVPL
jgi:EmrB/QacA subfamily drug resistance transporter